MNISNERNYETQNAKEEEPVIYEQLQILVSNPTSWIDGWWSDTVSDLAMGETVSNVCIKGKWPKISWDGEKLIVK